MDLTNIAEYTDAELLKAARWAIAQLMFSEEVTIAGRTVRRSALPEMRKQVQWLEERIAASGNSTGGFVALATLENVNLGSEANQDLTAQ
jgi:hypothetical protein